MNKVYNCPYMDEVAPTEEDRRNGFSTPTCSNPEPCDYPFYCPLKKDKDS